MPGSPRICPLDPLEPDPDIIRLAAGIIRAGGTVVFPATCLYGIAANAADPIAVEKVFAAKERPRTNPLLVLIHDRGQVDFLAATVPATAQALMDRFWPGRVTLVFQARRELPGILTSGTGKIGVRIPAHPVARALTAALGLPMTGTSANLSGMPGCSRVSDLLPQVLNRVDLVLDSGRLRGGAGSTVVDVTTSPVSVLREGQVPRADILAAVAQFH